jgi:hypothetical protein
LWDNLISRVKLTHSYTLQQNKPAYYGICLTAWWHYTHPGSKSIGSNLMAKHDYQVELASLCWNSSWRKDSIHENGIYVFSVLIKFMVMNEACSNFWLHCLATLVQTFLCLCFAHIGPEPSFTPPPLHSIPLTE